MGDRSGGDQGGAGSGRGEERAAGESGIGRVGHWDGRVFGGPGGRGAEGPPSLSHCVTQPLTCCVWWVWLNAHVGQSTTLPIYSRTSVSHRRTHTERCASISAQVFGRSE